MLFNKRKNKITSIKSKSKPRGIYSILTSLLVRGRVSLERQKYFLYFHHSTLPSTKKGSLTLLVIVYLGVFMVLMGAISNVALNQNKVQNAKENREKALQIAEAGLDYYRWFLAHYPTDLQDGTGVAGPYVHVYSDPEEGDIGEFSLDVSGELQCGELMSVDIDSTGHLYTDASKTRTVYGRYTRPSVAEYAYILNDNVWAGSDRVIGGKYHSNKGVVMDGTHDSLVTSEYETWDCTICDPDQNPAGGVTKNDGGNGNSALWEYPSPRIDFTIISQNFNNLEEYATTNNRYYGPSGAEGYHITFNSDGTMDISRVDTTVTNEYCWWWGGWFCSTEDIWAYDSDSGWHYEKSIPDTETTVATGVTFPSDCSVAYFEDNIWIEGEVNGKITIASADSGSGTTNAYLMNDILYTPGDGTDDGLTLLVENSILISPASENDLELNGIFLAKDGHFGRNHYTCSGGYALPDEYCSPVDYTDRNLLTINGSIISNGRVGTQWTSGGNFVSGYQSRVNNYDREQALDPPPLTPFTSEDYKFIEWRENE